MEVLFINESGKHDARKAPSPLEQKQQALPLFTLRESRRARNVRLQVTPSEGLVITVPPRFNPARLPSILEEKAGWIEKATSWAEQQRTARLRLNRGALPTVVFLQSIGEAWDVAYRPGPAGAVRAGEAQEDLLTLSGAVHDKEACREALKRWLARKTRQSLSPRLEALALEHGLVFQRLMVANQKTRWASCSPSGTISLNQKLLFLPERLMDYVLLHELCHTVHLDHSRRFWSLLAGIDPASRRLDRELREAGRYVPGWAE